jgi:hypothetical protein
MIVSQVNEIRKTAIQSPLLPLTVNKYSIYIESLVSKLFRVFAPTYLFVEGDEFFLPGRQGFFYFIDALFILFGMLSLYTKKRLYFFITCLFIVLGTFPHLFHRTTGDFSGHLALMFPFMVMLVGAGIVECIESLSKNMRSATTGVIIILYLLNVGCFCLLYFYRYPLMGYGDFHMRVLSRYLTLARRTNVPIAVYSNTSGDLFKKFLFYTDSMTKQTMNDIQKIDTRLTFTYNGIQFISCDENVKTAPVNTIVIYDMQCNMHINESHVRVSKLTDGGGIYEIFNDPVCGKYSLNPYPSGISTNDFSVETLSDERFCTVYINK